MPDTVQSPNPPPDWQTHSTELLCPLCTYNLRGLTAPRCPECGFAFAWQELLDAEQNRHPYLFEHGKGRNIVTFWKTWWRTCRPRRFWTDLNPAQPVRVVGLMVYWLIASGLLGVGLSGSTIGDAAKMAHTNYKDRSLYTGASQDELDEDFPMPWQLRFWRDYLNDRDIFGNHIFNSRYDSGNQPPGLAWAAIFLAWPWLTLIALLIFRRSMRKAKIRTIHLVRAAIYSCDFGLLFGVAFAGLYYAKPNLADGWLLVAAAMVCSVIASYRMTIAFSRYLRVHRPLETVLASQVISVLFVFTCLVWIADFSRQV